MCLCSDSLYEGEREKERVRERKTEREREIWIPGIAAVSVCLAPGLQTVSVRAL